MEKRKEKEIIHYDLSVNDFNRRNFEGFNPFNLQSYKFSMTLVKDKCKNKNVLDYGCGNGIHSLWLEKYAKEVIGIDLSRKSLEVARKRTKKGKFLLMDCEEMDFEDNSFNLIFDGGTFSSLDLDKALPELARVLKQDGFLIGIETLGHNPILNLKRKINRVRGTRTKWAVDHIFRIEDLKRVENYFGNIQVYFFHLISWMAFPFLRFSLGKKFLRLLEKIDRGLIKIFPFLKRYSFKIVFLFSLPKKAD